MRSNSHARPALQTSEQDDLSPAHSHIRSSALEARDRLVEAGEFIKTVVTTRPALALGAALAAGVVLGWLIKRR
jgi:ElaB/YqjD/DUF883 family membrane-anchored ribosome-binding protein